MALSEKKRITNDKWIKENYKQVKLSMPNAEADELETHCSAYGFTKAGFIREAIKDKLRCDTTLQPPESPQDGDLVLSELGYDPLAKKPIYRDKHTGKHYFVEQIKKETAIEGSDEDTIPF